jgi:hypothetical protein
VKKELQELQEFRSYRIGAVFRSVDGNSSKEDLPVPRMEEFSSSNPSFDGSTQTENPALPIL